MRHAHDQCLRCGRKGHFVLDCFARTDTSGNCIRTNSSSSSVSVKSSSSRKRKGPTVNTGKSANGTDRVVNKKTKVKQHRTHASHRDKESDEEDMIGDCLRCGRLGHFFDSCYAKTTARGEAIDDDDEENDDDDDDDDDDEDDEVDACFRCGRTGHFASNCYAKTSSTTLKRILKSQ